MYSSELDSAAAAYDLVLDSNSTSQPVPLAERRVFKSISVVFPAYNEQENIAQAVEHAIEVFGTLFEEFEVVVVNDGSKDKTQDVLDALHAKYPFVRSERHVVNKGYGSALRTGLYAARKELVFFSDSDLQFDLSEIQLLLFYIYNHDIVAGYRANRADPWNRRLNAWGWNRLVRMVLGVKVRDIDCAFKLFRRDVFKIIQLESVGAMINTELFARAMQNRMAIKEVPVSHYPRRAGEQTGSNLRVIIKAFRELFVMSAKLRTR